MADDPNLKPNPGENTENNGGNGSDPSEKLTPDHPRFKEVLDSNRTLKEQNAKLAEGQEELRRELDALKSNSTQRQTTGEDDLTDEQREALTVIQRQLKKDGYVTKADLEDDRNAIRVANQLEKLSDKYDGSNGYPEFVPEDVIAFSKKRGIADLEDAYALMHYDAIKQVDAKKFNESPKPPSAEKPTGSERQIGTDLTAEKVAAMSGAEYEQNRDKILSSLKSQGKK